MLNSRMKLVLILSLQIIIFLLDYPPSDSPSLQVEITVKKCACVESKTSLELQCKLTSLLNNDLMKSTQQCLMAFAVMRRLCTDLSGKYDGSDVFISPQFWRLFSIVTQPLKIQTMDKILPNLCFFCEKILGRSCLAN